jgi:hypothetical protein
MASVLKMKIVCFSENLVRTYESTRRQNPEQHQHHDMRQLSADILRDLCNIFCKFWTEGVMCGALKLSSTACKMGRTDSGWRPNMDFCNNVINFQFTDLFRTRATIKIQSFLQVS